MKKLFAISFLLLISTSANAAHIFTPGHFENATFTLNDFDSDGSFSGTIHLSADLNEISKPIDLKNLSTLEPRINEDVISALTGYFSGFDNFSAGLDSDGPGVSANFDFEEHMVLINLFASNIVATNQFLLVDLDTSVDVLIGGAQALQVSEVPVPAAIWMFAPAILAFIGKRKAITPQLA